MFMLKAIVGSALAGLTSLQVAADGGVTFQEWVQAGIAALVALGVIWAVPNKPAPPATP